MGGSIAVTEKLVFLHKIMNNNKIVVEGKVYLVQHEE